MALCHSCLIWLLCITTICDAAKDVIIVGAGISGAAAARHLANTGDYQVTLLEAREDRLGGRLWTDHASVDRALGGESDMGAPWLWGYTENSEFHSVLRNLDVFLREPGLVMLVNNHGNQTYDGLDLHDKLQKYAVTSIREAVAQRKTSNDIPVSEVLSKSSPQFDLEKSSWNAVLTSFVEASFGTSLSDVSLTHFQPMRISPGYHVTEGLEEIVNRLISGVTGEQPLPVELDKTVRQIQIDESTHTVKVRTIDRKGYRADAVIVTVPLGVLKQGSIIFDPGFSAERQHAIEKMGYGVTNRLIVQFYETFWSDDVGVFLSTHPTAENGLKLRTWLNGHRLTNSPFLSTYISGEEARLVEEMSDEALRKLVETSLTDIFGTAALETSPIMGIRRSAWGSDPHSRGSNSYPAVGCTLNERRLLSKPICPYIYFAGEHTSIDKSGTIEGAYMSGIEAAEALIRGCEHEHKDSNEHKPHKYHNNSGEL